MISCYIVCVICSHFFCNTNTKPSFQKKEIVQHSRGSTGTSVPVFLEKHFALSRSFSLWFFFFFVF